MNHVLTISTSQRFAKYLLIFLFSFFTNIPFSVVFAEKICQPHLLQALTSDPKSVILPPEKTCPQTHNLIAWLKARRETPAYPAISAFLNKNPTWPLQQALRKKAEQDLIDNSYPSAKVLRWFQQFPPLSPAGIEAHADALVNLEKKADASKIIKAAWRTEDLSAAQQKRWLTKYGHMLEAADHFARASFLLNQEKKQIDDLRPHLQQSQKKLIEIRLALLNKEPGAEKKTASLSKEFQKDPGLLYERVKWLRRLDRNTQMLHLILSTEVCQHVPPHLIWKERNLLTRRLMDEKRYADAYRLIKGHNLKNGEDFATGEWLAGWLCLRFLHKPQQALLHFQTLHNQVKSPISIARAAYWMGRTFEALKKTTDAKIWFEKAQQHGATYYGQLAAKHLTGKNISISVKTPNISPVDKKTFDAKPIVQLIHILGKAGASADQLEPFFLAAIEKGLQSHEQVLLIHLAHQYGNAYTSVLIAKKSTKTHAPLIPAAYPKLPLQSHKKLAVDPAIVHAIIRQESRFKADALSSAGAMGLMQLMPETAKQTAKKFDLPLKNLYRPDANVQIGSHHLKELMDKYDQSLVLTAAAYNAGSTAVQNWIKTYGDPRAPDVDMHDWVELIPYAETRNYVQRVLENYHCYQGF